MQNNVIIIGISGPSASGKSLLAHTIVKEIGSDQVAIISEDSYYKEQANMPFEQREKTNYDHPDSLDHALLSQHLEQLTQGGAVEIPIYNYSEHTRSTETKRVDNHCIIVLEGILLFVDPEFFKVKPEVETTKAPSNHIFIEPSATLLSEESCDSHETVCHVLEEKLCFFIPLKNLSGIAKSS